MPRIKGKVAANPKKPKNCREKPSSCSVGSGAQVELLNALAKQG